MGTYQHVNKVSFLNSIGYNWFGPVTEAWRYAELCNLAEAHGMEIVAILENGVVYKTIIK